MITNTNGFLNDILTEILDRPRYREEKQDLDRIEQQLKDDVDKYSNILDQKKARLSDFQESRKKAEEEQLREQQRQANRIQYQILEDQIELRVPRFKLVKMVESLAKALKDSPEAKTYKVTINLQFKCVKVLSV